MASLEINAVQEMMSGRTTILASFYPMFEDALQKSLLSEIIQQIAARYVSENYADIAAKLDQQAIANLSVAEAGAKINETLAKKLPDRILEIERVKQQVQPIIVDRGFFGGIKSVTM